MRELLFEMLLKGSKFMVGVSLLLIKASYTKVLAETFPTEVYKGCSKTGQQINASNGIIEYQHEPKSSTSIFIKCWWMITAPQNYVISLSLRTFEIGSKHYKDCKRTTTLIALFDRIPDHDTKPMKWQCNMDNYPNIVTERSFLAIRLIASTASAPKFILEFQTISKNITSCSSNLINISATNEKQYISSPLFPNFPPSKQRCTWMITAPQYHVIILSFIKVEIEVSQFCKFDHVILRDGPNSTSPVLAKLCGTNHKCPTVSSGRYMWIEYKTDPHGIRNGFNASYMATKQDFSNVSNTVVPLQNQGQFNIYITRQQLQRKDDSLICLWKLTVPKGRTINMSVSTNKDFAARYVCLEEHLDVLDGQSLRSPVILRRNYTQSSMKTVLKSRGRHLLIRLVPNHKGTSCVFEIQFKAISENIVSTTSVPFPSMYPTVTTTPADVFNFTNSTKPIVRKSSKNTNSTMLVGIMLGSTIGLVLFIVFIYVLVRKRIKSKNERIFCDPWEIMPKDVELIEELGQGAFGKVWRGRITKNVGKRDTTIRTNTGFQKKKPLKDSLGIGLDMTKSLNVAVKVLHGDANEEEKQEFHREIKFMKNVGSHKNIISMVACCTTEKEVFLVVEIAKYGDLLNFIRNERKKMQRKPYYEIQSNIDEENEKLTAQSMIKDMISFSWQIAEGMSYLASKGIVHRDLAARNILVAEDLLVKVSDFGLSRQVAYEDQIYQAKGPRKLPIKWMSPEAIYEQSFTTKSDVWSYGVVLWEIYSLGGAPYPTITNRQLYQMLKRGYRMDKPDLCPNDVYNLMTNCWQEHAEQRPSFTDILQNLEILMTHDNPYVEFKGINEDDECYLVPSYNSAPEEHEESGDETTVV